MKYFADMSTDDDIDLYGPFDTEGEAEAWSLTVKPYGGCSQVIAASSPEEY